MTPLRFSSKLAASAAVVLALSCAPGAVSAQDAPRDTGAGGALPGPNANTPGSAAHPSDGSNWEQPVPGAMPGSDTVPSTISEKNAADDRQIILAYTFRHLTDEQRQAIYRALKDQPAGTAINADVGIELPYDVALHEMPDAVITQVPDTKRYQYAVADNRVLLVSPELRVVVAVISDAAAVTTGERRRPATGDGAR